MSRSVSRHWERARSYLRLGQLEPARAQWESLRALAPNDPRTHVVVARIALQEGCPGDAAAHALDAARVVDDDPVVLGDLVETLWQAGESATAHGLLDVPAWRHREDPDTLLRHADFRRRFGEHAAALAAVDRVLAARPDDAAMHHFRGQELQFLGRLAEAEAAYVKSLALAPGYARAAYDLVRLRPQTVADHRLATIEAGLARIRTGSRDYADFQFARYHVLEDLGRPDLAWQALATANAVLQQHAAADVEREQAGTRFLCDAAAAHPPRVAAAQPAGPRPIFIVGLPRAGTTVLERMLANHSQVASAGELGDFGRQLLRVANTDATYDAEFFARQLALDFADVGRGYLAQTSWRAGGKPNFIDKLPGNCMVAGLVHAALPEARILHVVRDPMDSCFSAWRAQFGNSYAWSYAFDTLATHYRQYRELMRTWHAAFPGAILDVAYEDLVRDPGATLRRVVDHCDLAWEPGCEDLTRNTTPVATLSSVQVREPVHARTLGHWRRYAEQLEPLRRSVVLES